MSKIPPSVVALIAIVVLVVLGWAVLPNGDTIGDEFRLPVIAVFAMAAMFAVLAFIAAVFKSADMGSSTQALGLPEGSVRALIALSLIVIFAVITLFMLTRLTESKAYCSELVALLHQQESKKPDASEQKQSVAAGTVTTPNVPTTSSGGGSQPTTPTGGPAGSGGGGAAGGSNGTGGAAGAQTQTSGGTQSSAISEAIAGVNKRQDAAQDLAKQLLTMLGTLLAAVSSFYFGSSATSSAVAAAGRNNNPDPTAKPQSPSPSGDMRMSTASMLPTEAPTSAPPARAHA